MKCVINAKIHDGIHREPFMGNVWIDGGKFVKISKDEDANGNNAQDPSVEWIDAGGLDLYPGFVDAHSHIGLDGYGIGYEGMDYNEMNDIACPQLRGLDGVKAMDPAFEMAEQAGVTSVCTGPGSANVLGGTFTTIKTVGKCVEDMIIRPQVAMKCAFGENPKRVYKDKGNSSRMSTAAKLREMLFKARDYMNRKEAAGHDVSKYPAFDMKMEALIPVLKGEMPLKAHAHASDDIFTALRIAREFNVKLTLEHVTEGHLIAEKLACERDVPMAVGPSLTNASKFELRNKSFTTPGILAQAGCQVSIITDAPVIPQQYLPLCAGLAVKSGMDPFAALQAITINAAKHAQIGDRVGSVEVGKDADFSLFKGSPFDVSGEAAAVYINGKKVFGL